jgi:hypothetical protein
MDIYELLRAEAKAKKAGEPVKEQYGRISIDLSTARDDEELHISGNQITIAGCDGGATTTYFKLNSKHSRKVYPAEITKVLGNFGGVYLSNAAEAGKTLTLYLGRDIFIFPARAEANRILKADGTTINPVRDERYGAHTFGSLKPTTMTAANTAQPLIAASTKVKWAIIHTLSKIALVGDSTVTRGGGANDGQKYGEDVYIAFEYVDLSEVYIINYAVGEQCIYSINYVKEEA